MFVLLSHTLMFYKLILLFGATVAKMYPYVDSPVINLLGFFFLLFFCFFLFRYHCHTLPLVSPRAVGTVTQSKVLWIGTRVPSCQPTNCQVSGTLPTPMEGNIATTTLLHTHNQVCHRLISKLRSVTSFSFVKWMYIWLESELHSCLVSLLAQL